MVDRNTGVNYLQFMFGTGCEITLLLDENGQVAAEE
ncbi:DUF6440 family protein [Alkalicoccus daliensis]|nr:DUF6440 family protein [Alkalicoccus daliensis]